MLPGIDGLDVCRALRSDSRTARIPVIMLTAKSAESDRILGLELGADDYVTKPFSPRELLARIKAVLRRTSSPQAVSEVIRRGNLTIDMARRTVTCGGETIVLTATEFRLLQFFASHSGHVFSRAQLIDGAMGRDVSVEDRTIDVHITGLRKKLGNCGDWIETVRGFGYRFRDDEEAEELAVSITDQPSAFSDQPHGGRRSLGFQLRAFRRRRPAAKPRVKEPRQRVRNPVSRDTRKP